MSNAIGSNIKKFTISGPKSGKSVDFSTKTSGIKYFEDIFDPSIHVDLGIQDALGQFNKVPVRSGNKVNLEIESQGSKLSLDLIISNIIGYNPQAKREVYGLIMETQSAFDNHTTRVFEKYKGKVSDSVAKILKDKLNITKVDIDESSNNYDFCGGYRRPLLACSWLAKKSIGLSTKDDTKGSAGFLFYQTQDGFHFKNIDKLFEEARSNKNIIKYQYKVDKNTLKGEENFLSLIGQPITSSSHNLLVQLTQGHYKTANWYYDIITKQPKFVEFSYQDSLGEMKTSNSQSLIPKGIDENYSRILLQTVDTGCLSNKGELNQTPSEQYYYQAQSTARYSSMMSQKLFTTVPLNLKLRAGMVIYLKLPEINKTRLDGPASGNYLISKLCHEFGGDSDKTGLELVRDSYKELK